MVESLHSDRSPLPFHRLVAFANFEVDLQAGEIRKAGMRLKLTGQPFQVLAILLERPGEVVTREELQKRLWPDTFVDVDHNLNTAINKIREVLGDSAENPRFVETLARRGYRFVAPIAQQKPIGKAGRPASAPAETGLKPAREFIWGRWAAITGATVMLIGLTVVCVLAARRILTSRLYHCKSSPEFWVSIPPSPRAEPNSGVGSKLKNNDLYPGVVLNQSIEQNRFTAIGRVLCLKF